MNLRDYLKRHDTKPRPDGPECIRLAAAVGLSTYYLYLAALGHKTVGPARAIALHRSSIGGALQPEDIRPDYQFTREADGRIAYTPTAKVA